MGRGKCSERGKKVLRDQRASTPSRTSLRNRISRVDIVIVDKGSLIQRYLVSMEDTNDAKDQLAHCGHLPCRGIDSLVRYSLLIPLASRFEQ